jgi:hypothetical protein
VIAPPELLDDDVRDAELRPTPATPPTAQSDTPPAKAREMTAQERYDLKMKQKKQNPS